MTTVAQPVFTPELALAVRDLLLQNLRHEFETTKKVIAAVPEDKCNYRPDPKSKSARELAWHLASAELMFLQGVANLKFVAGAPPEEPQTIAGISRWYEQQFPAVSETIANLRGDQLLTPVEFHGMLNLPAFQYLLLTVTHSVHHRGQLATYLRPMGSKVPSIYGGSADTQG